MQSLLKENNKWLEPILPSGNHKEKFIKEAFLFLGGKKMSLRKTLAGIVMVGALALGAGCSKDYSAYNYDGKIGEEQVKFKQKHYNFSPPSDNILTVTKPDGTIVTYADREKDDLKLEYVVIIKGGVTTKYWRDEVGKPVLAEAQRQFDDYLQKIKESKIKKGLVDLK